MSRMFGIDGEMMSEEDNDLHVPIAVLYRAKKPDAKKVEEMLAQHGQKTEEYILIGKFEWYIGFMNGTFDHGFVKDINWDIVNRIFGDVADKEYDKFRKECNEIAKGKHKDIKIELYEYYGVNMTKEDYIEKNGYFSTMGVINDKGYQMEDNEFWAKDFKKRFLDDLSEDTIIAIVDAKIILKDVVEMVS